MKILIDARSMGTKPSGIGMYIYNFAKRAGQRAGYGDPSVI